MADFQSFIDSNFFRDLSSEIADVANNLWIKGWAERNAGNFSINITAHFDNFRPVEGISNALSSDCRNLANMFFLVSGTGSRMRHLSFNPIDFLTIVYINQDTSAFGYYPLAGNSAGKPTSELPTHLAIHNLVAGQSNNPKAVLHAHVTELIALTHIPEINNEGTLNRIISGMHPECSMFIPGGCGYVPYCLPGSDEMAAATVTALKNHEIAIWEKHGAFVIAPDMQQAFDMLDIYAKSADIYLRCRNAGFIPEGLK